MDVKDRNQWEDFERKVQELESDQEEYNDCLFKKENLKAEKGREKPIFTLLGIAVIGAAIGGLINGGFWGLLIDGFSWIIWLGLIGLIDNKIKENKYLKKLPDVQNKLDELERKRENRYTGLKIAASEILLTENIFTVESIRFVKQYLEQGLDLDESIYSYKTSAEYRPNLITKKSKLNQEFLANS